MKKELRINVWNKYKCKCAYCGEQLEIKQMQVDHLIPQSNFIWHIKNNRNIPDFLKHLTIDDINHIDNLMPACRQCNFYKGSWSLDGFREQLATIIERIKKPFIVRLALKYGIISFKPFDNKFYFEKL